DLGPASKPFRARNALARPSHSGRRLARLATMEFRHGGIQHQNLLLQVGDARTGRFPRGPLLEDTQLVDDDTERDRQVAALDSPLADRLEKRLGPDLSRFA